MPASSAALVITTFALPLAVPLVNSGMSRRLLCGAVSPVRYSPIWSFAPGLLIPLQ